MINTLFNEMWSTVQGIESMACNGYVSCQRGSRPVGEVDYVRAANVKQYVLLYM